MAFGLFKTARRPAVNDNGDRRAARRGRVLLGGKIVYGPGFTADCTIRDLTPTGARVMLPEHQPSPPDFYLIVVRDGVAHRARTTWTRHPMAGVVFETSYDLADSPPPRMRAIQDLWGALSARA